jgi:Ca2+-transporting ATPase
MARRHALVRRLPAVEALGSTTIVCTDKTRTLTSGKMSLVRVWSAGQSFTLDVDSPAAGTDATLRRALESAAMACRTQASGAKVPDHGDPVDLAVLRAAALNGIDRESLVRQQPPLGLLPFSSERKLMATFHAIDGAPAAYVKGAPRQVLALCDRVWEQEGRRPLDDAARRELLAVNERLAGSGLRVLALAAGPVDAPAEASLRSLTLVGFVGLIDPPHRGVAETIARLRRAGLRTIMLTGDQRLTAEAIGRQLEVLGAGERVMDGGQIDALSPEALRTELASVGALSRVSPEHKMTIVKSLQARGEIVAMLGDGVNDAPALKQADVGVAMGIRGTDAAKEAAAIVLQDDRFETIAAAVEEGRIIYDNIRKFVFYLFSCNVAEVLVLLVAGLAGLPLPLLPLQILWLNMVTDTFPALALALEPGDADVMNRPPRNPQEALLSRTFIGSVLLYGGLITASTLAAFLWAIDDPERATTVSFMTLALAQILHLGTARSSEAVLRPARALANPYALGAVVLAVALQLVAMYLPPLAAVLHVVPLGGREWLVVVALAALPAMLGQAARLRRGKRGP